MSIFTLLHSSVGNFSKASLFLTLKCNNKKYLVAVSASNRKVNAKRIIKTKEAIFK